MWDEYDDLWWMANNHKHNMERSAGGGRTRKLVAAFVAAILTAAVLTAGTACSQDTNTAPRMIRSSEEFQRGMRAGRLEAKRSWSEHSGAWGWLWMMNEDYRTGHGEGWRRGRAEIRFKRQKERASRQVDPGAER